MARYIIYGAGAVGCLIGGQLRLRGHDVLLIARGSHRDALLQGGLRFRTPVAEHVIDIPVADAISDVGLCDTDTVVLTMKTQDSAAALTDLARVAPSGITIVCAQNGVESERLALRLFEHVYGAYVFVFATITQPGIASCYTSPCMGIVDVGRYPQGSDQRSDALTADLQASGFQSIPRSDVMAWKRGSFSSTSPMSFMPLVFEVMTSRTLLEPRGRRRNPVSRQRSCNSYPPTR